VVKLEKFAKIKEQKLNGLKKSQASRNLGLDYKTISKYWDMSNEEYIKLNQKSKNRAKKIDRYKNKILEWIKENQDMTTAQIQDWLLENNYNLDFSERTLRLFVKNLREEYDIPKSEPARQYEAVEELPMGFQSQVDLGSIWLKKMNGSKVKIYCFAMVLAHSRYKFLWWSDKPFTTLSFIDAHIKAFEYFGGIPIEIVYDQDRILAVSENSGDIIYTERFQNYLNSVRFKIRLCRTYDPESKGKIEAVVKYAKNNFAKHRIFEDIKTFNEKSLKWLERTGNKKIHETTKKVPVEVFSLEKEQLMPVPNLFTNQIDTNILTYTLRKDNTVSYKQNRYQVPKGTYKPGKEVNLKIIDNKMDIIDKETGEIIISHTVSYLKGKLITLSHPERDKNIKNVKVKEIYQKTLKELGQTKEAEEFLNTVAKEKSRYIKDQCTAVLKAIKNYEPDIIEKALKYCIKRNLCSAGNLKDVLIYLSERNTKIASITKYKSFTIAIPSKYKDIKPENRDISEYINSFEEDKDRWIN
jgi:transposase